jgi:hypothetical protein
MTADLERRRQAIAEALRAIMAEPFPDRTAPSPQAAAAPPAARSVDPPPRRALVVVTEPDPVTVDPPPGTPDADPEPRVEPAPLTSPPPLRAALSAHIDWAEVEELEDLDEDWEAPSVPPLETTGGMSRTASMALFGHA